MPDDVGEILVQIGSPEGDVRPVYANYVVVSNSPLDVELRFALVHSPTEGPGPEDAERGMFVVTPALQADVIVPMTLVPQLVSLLNDRLAAMSVQGEASEEMDE
jgi:hypothetical protein